MSGLPPTCDDRGRYARAASRIVVETPAASPLTVVAVHDAALRKKTRWRRAWTHVVAMGFAVLAVYSARADSSPLAALRANVDAALAVLNNDDADREARHTRLCAIANDLFDPLVFSRLALGAHWSTFTSAEQDEFTAVVADYLCTYYLTRLQLRYRDERVVYGAERWRSRTLASVAVEVLWQDARVPLEVRMTLRDGRWRAFDLVFMGVSVVKVYRQQFQVALREASATQLIAQLRARARTPP